MINASGLTKISWRHWGSCKVESTQFYIDEANKAVLMCYKIIFRPTVVYCGTSPKMKANSHKKGLKLLHKSLKNYVPEEELGGRLCYLGFSLRHTEIISDT
jgi:hypothetical protein